ncbi:MAG TPA: hypothetical protein VGY98_05765 [Verrucomicrobiae bacterium]|jgi:hypothetical protein|nr:hypothetical protein [Verrucomicrobiae bacterium]
MEKHTFPLPEQHVSALDELKDQIDHRRGHFLLSNPWTLLALGLAVVGLVRTITRVRR